MQLEKRSQPGLLLLPGDVPRVRPAHQRATCSQPANYGRPSRHRSSSTIRPTDRLCSECHQHPRGNEFEHSGYNDADCVKCHDPHGGSNKNFLLTLDQGKMCGQCHGRHESTTAAGKARLQHKPFVDQQCLSCHAAHRSDHEKLTLLPKNELCLECHSDFIEQFPALLTLHEPVSKDCGACHLSDGGGPHLIRSMTKNLCLGCHQSHDWKVKDHSSCNECHKPAEVANWGRHLPDGECKVGARFGGVRASMWGLVLDQQVRIDEPARSDEIDKRR
jgi:predicted CXXCH cytochrome family protein